RCVSRTSRVRPGLARYEDLCIFTEAAGRAMPGLIACHLPPTPGLAWLGGPLQPVPDPDNEHRRWQRPAQPHCHLVIAGDPAVVAPPPLAPPVGDQMGAGLSPPNGYPRFRGP